MSTPVVAGAAALLLEANPKLTPNLVKMILMYTAQPISGFNTFEQGAGELNIAGAVALAKIVRTDLRGLTTPAVGWALLTQSAPNPQSNIANYTFAWSQGLVLNHVTATGTDLINKYQKVYGTGYLLGNGVIETTNPYSLNTSMWTGRITPGSNIMSSNGTPMFGGSVFCSLVMLSDGVVMGDGVVLGDGVVMGDGVVLGDGVVMGD